MSVYTPVSEEQLTTFLGHYDLGELIDFEGISAGIENTNYFVTTSRDRLVLTLFESHSHDELVYFLDLMAHLAEHQVPSAHPIPDDQGAYLRTLNDKPAALVKRLRGRHIEQPNLAQCTALGRELAQLHVAGQSFSGHRDNDRGPRWWRQTSKALAGHLDEAEQAMLDRELAFQSEHRTDDLPRGVIHADLFRDNALFDGDQLTGIIDFYYACNDVLLYDVGVTINDWCSLADGGVDNMKASALLHAYQQVRPIDAAELAAWPVMLRAGALRFWLSRLHDLHFPREGEMTHTKDPDVFKCILQQRIAHEDELRSLWHPL
jgi:homoserine kinase type II